MCTRLRFLLPSLRLQLWRLVCWMAFGLDEVFCIRKQITSLHVIPLDVIMSGLTNQTRSILDTQGIAESDRGFLKQEFSPNLCETLHSSYAEDTSAMPFKSPVRAEALPFPHHERTCRQFFQKYELSHLEQVGTFADVWLAVCPPCCGRSVECSSQPT